MAFKLAALNSFPNLSNSAELELINRLRLWSCRTGVDFHEVTTSHDILNLNANLVLNLHEVSPKLTPATTLGTMWNPPSGIIHDRTRCEFIRSYDGYLPASDCVRSFVKKEVFDNSTTNIGSISGFNFYPSCLANIRSAKSYNSLVYLGVHWDGFRHNDVLQDLASTNSISFYGPSSAWKHIPQAYRGSIGFDGQSVVNEIAEHGVVLCLHRQPHIECNTPSMRLFEAASAGCLIISDAIEFAKVTFGDSIFIMPETEDRAEFIREKLSWSAANPRKARDMARNSQSIFEKNYSLDILMPKVLDFGRSLSRSRLKRPFVQRVFRSRSRSTSSTQIAQATQTPSIKLFPQ